MSGVYCMNDDFVLYQLRAEMWNIILADWQSELVSVKYWS